MIISLFFTVFLFLHIPGAEFQENNFMVDVTKTAWQQEDSTLLEQLERPESLELGDEEAKKPYEGFSAAMIFLFILIHVVFFFVIYKVFKRMRKTDKGKK